MGVMNFFLTYGGDELTHGDDEKTAYSCTHYEVRENTYLNNINVPKHS